MSRSGRIRVGRAVCPPADLSWQPLYRIGGYSALLFVALVVLPVTLVIAAPVPPTQGRAVLEYIAAHAERAGLVSAAEALIAATNAVSWAGILTAASILVLSMVMWPGRWGQALAIVGVAAGAIGVVSEGLRPLIGPAHLVYGLLLPIWFAWVGWKLFHVSASARVAGS